MKFLILPLAFLLVATTAQATAESFLCELESLINAQRQQAGLQPLQRNKQLDSYAAQWADHLASTQKLSHRSRDSLASIQRELSLSYINENLYGADSPRPAQRVFNAWMNSAGHRRNLLHPQANQLGLGRASGPRGHLRVVFHAATHREQ